MPMRTMAPLIHSLSSCTISLKVCLAEAIRWRNVLVFRADGSVLITPGPTPAWRGGIPAPSWSHRGGAGVISSSWSPCCNLTHGRCLLSSSLASRTEDSEPVVSLGTSVVGGNRGSRLLIPRKGSSLGNLVALLSSLTGSDSDLSLDDGSELASHISDDDGSTSDDNIFGLASSIGDDNGSGLASGIDDDDGSISDDNGPALALDTGDDDGSKLASRLSECDTVIPCPRSVDGISYSNKCIISGSPPFLTFGASTLSTSSHSGSISS